MRKQLRVLLDEQEHDDLRELARREEIPVSEFVRRRLREAARRVPRRDFESKLRAIRNAARHDFPTADIDQTLGEIEGGRAGRPGG